MARDGAAIRKAAAIANVMSDDFTKCLCIVFLLEKVMANDETLAAEAPPLCSNVALNGATADSAQSYIPFGALIYPNI